MIVSFSNVRARFNLRAAPLLALHTYTRGGVVYDMAWCNTRSLETAKKSYPTSPHRFLTGRFVHHVGCAIAPFQLLFFPPRGAGGVASAGTPRVIRITAGVRVQGAM